MSKKLTTLLGGVIIMSLWACGDASFEGAPETESAVQAEFGLEGWAYVETTDPGVSVPTCPDPTPLPNPEGYNCGVGSGAPLTCTWDDGGTTRWYQCTCQAEFCQACTEPDECGGWWN